MIPRETIVTALGNANVKAWLQVIRHRETDHTNRAYHRVNGRPDLTSLAAHPYYGVPTTQGSRAAGAYQDLGTTWQRIAERYPKDCGDFSPYAQDFGAVVGTSDRGALQDVIDGDVATACRKCRLEWSSLPGGSENTGYTDKQALQVFEEYGGVAATQPVAPIVDESVELQSTEEKPMGIALTLLPLLAQYIPQIMSLVKPDSKSTAKDAQIAQTVLNVAAQAAGVIQAGQQATAANVGATVDALQNNPELAKKVQEAVVTHPDIIGVLEIGGGVKAAREFGTAIQVGDKGFWLNPTFWISVLFFPMMYMIVASILFTVAPDAKSTVEDIAKMVWYQKIGFDPNTRTGALNLIIGFVFGGIVGVWFGTSYGSQRKTELSAIGKDGV
jgi:muramidase (phage lysozyme)